MLFNTITLELITSAYKFMYPEKRDEIEKIENGLLSLFTFQWISPKYGENNILKSFEVNKDIKTFFKSWFLSPSPPKELGESWALSEKLTSDDKDEHMKSEEAKIQNLITTNAILQSDSSSLTNTDLYKSLLPKSVQKIETPVAQKTDTSKEIPESIFPG